MDTPHGSACADEWLLRRLVELGIALSAETNRDRLLETLLLEAKSLTNADGGTLYLMTDDDQLRFEIIRKNVASHAALSKSIVVIDDTYHAKGFDFAGTRTFDARTGYRSTSFMTVPLMTTGGEVVGALQLINAGGAVTLFAEGVRAIIASLASQAAIAIDNRQLLDAQRALLDSFIKVIANAIDEKSPYTGGHCQRVPEITNLLAKAAVEQTQGPFAYFTLNDDTWYALHLAGWLHDCGKVTAPEYVVDKSTKLETIGDRLHEVRTRFEVLRRDAEIRCLSRQLAGENKAAAEAALATKIKTLEDDLAFVTECNLGGEFMSDDKIARLKEIGGRTWTRHFDRRIGLSWEDPPAFRRCRSCAPPRRTSACSTTAPTTGTDRTIWTNCTPARHPVGRGTGQDQRPCRGHAPHAQPVALPEEAEGDPGICGVPP